MGLIRWWVDGFFAIHHDIRGQSRSIMMLGRGAVVSGSIKQRINCKSFTNTEVMLVDDYMPKILWCGYFVDWQGYKMKTLLYQDNISSKLLEINGQKSMGTQ